MAEFSPMSVDDLDDRQAARVQRLAPEILVRAADVDDLDRFIIQEIHRDEPGIGCALHVVLAAQQVQAGSRPADMAGDQRKRD
jgi:hypothetical protein